MKKLVFLLAIFILTILGQCFSLQALTIDSSPPPATSPDVLVTSLISLDGSLPDYIEIYNQSSSPINIADLKLIFAEADTSCNGLTIKPSLAAAQGYILAKKYFTLQRVPSASGAGQFSVDSTVLNSCDNPWLSSLQIAKADTIEQSLAIPGSSTLAPTIDSTVTPAVTTYYVAQHHQRSNSISSTRTLSGSFADDYNVSALSGATELYSDPLYIPPSSTAGLKVIELLPHALNCSPLDASLTCGDYIKLFNSTSADIDLSNYRLRTSYGGNKSSTSNTINLSGILAAGKYSLVNSKNDGSPLSLTESGGYVWLEDTYGSEIYTPVIAYPDASSASKLGWAWALDGSSWRWTSLPQPSGPNIFLSADIATLSLSTGSNLAACAAGQYRNPATNRCKSLSTTASTASLAPCPTGQERNPATNRCRQSLSSVLGDSSLNIADVAAPTIANSTQWALAGGALALALGYGVFEWRQEILLGLSDSRAKLMTLLKSFKS